MTGAGTAPAANGGSETPARFRGSLVRSSLSKGGFWNTLTVTRAELVLGHWPHADITVDRGATDEIRFRRTSLPLWWGIDVTFETAGPAAGYIFRPARPRKLRAALSELGWPVVELTARTLRNPRAR